MRRIIKSDADAPAGIEVTEGSSKMAGDNNNFFYTDSSGVYVVGNTSFLCEPQNMKVAALFRFPTAYEMMIPSTSTTPRPQLIPDPPIRGFASIAEAVAEFMAELV